MFYFRMSLTAASIRRLSSTRDAGSTFKCKQSLSHDNQVQTDQIRNKITAFVSFIQMNVVQKL